MIISRTPFRISFFGGGSDYPAWFAKHGGKVLSTSFDKYSYISCRILPPFFDHKYRLAYSKVEHVSSLAEIGHPAIKAVLEECGFSKGLDIHHYADLPARSGIGSSSSFIVGLLNAIQALGGKCADKDALAAEAIRIEQSVMRENVGNQDQTAAAFGGLNVIEFNRDGTSSVSPLPASGPRKQELNRHLLLFFTGFSRTASDIAKSKIANLEREANSIHRMMAMVGEASEILLSDTVDIREFGKLLDDSWRRKRALSEHISTPVIDRLYDTAISHGALGGKLLGAGGGGFILFFANPGDHGRIKAALANLVHVPFEFETSGSTIIYSAK